jgi:hypothetical protein
MKSTARNRGFFLPNNRLYFNYLYHRSNVATKIATDLQSLTFLFRTGINCIIIRALNVIAECLKCYVLGGYLLIDIDDYN